MLRVAQMMHMALRIWFADCLNMTGESSQGPQHPIRTLWKAGVTARVYQWRLLTGYRTEYKATRVIDEWEMLHLESSKYRVHPKKKGSLPSFPDMYKVAR